LFSSVDEEEEDEEEEEEEEEEEDNCVLTATVAAALAYLVTRETTAGAFEPVCFSATLPFCRETEQKKLESETKDSKKKGRNGHGTLKTTTEGRESTSNFSATSPDASASICQGREPIMTNQAAEEKTKETLANERMLACSLANSSMT
jgi:hypothetical protein